MRNRIALLLLITLLFAASSFAQDAMPTKEETVNYLNKRLQEVEGRTEKVNSDLTRKFTNLSFTMRGGVAVYAYSRLFGPDSLRINTFNPAHIDNLSVVKPTEGETIGWVYVRFRTNLVKQTCKNQCDESINFFGFPYLAATTEVGEKIKKAFLHLRDLAKAEDDLF